MCSFLLNMGRFWHKTLCFFYYYWKNESKWQMLIWEWAAFSQLLIPHHICHLKPPTVKALFWKDIRLLSCGSEYCSRIAHLTSTVAVLWILQSLTCGLNSPRMRSDFAEVDVSTNSFVISNQPADATEVLLTERYFNSQKWCQPGEVPLCRSIFLDTTNSS